MTAQKIIWWRVALALVVVTFVIALLAFRELLAALLIRGVPHRSLLLLALPLALAWGIAATVGSRTIGGKRALVLATCCLVVAAPLLWYRSLPPSGVPGSEGVWPEAKPGEVWVRWYAGFKLESTQGGGDITDVLLSLPAPHVWEVKYMDHSVSYDPNENAYYTSVWRDGKTYRYRLEVVDGEIVRYVLLENENIDTSAFEWRTLVDKTHVELFGIPYGPKELTLRVWDGSEIVDESKVAVLENLQAYYGYDPSARWRVLKSGSRVKVESVVRSGSGAYGSKPEKWPENLPFYGCPWEGREVDANLVVPKLDIRIGRLSPGESFTLEGYGLVDESFTLKGFYRENVAASLENLTLINGWDPISGMFRYDIKLKFSTPISGYRFESKIEKRLLEKVYMPEGWYSPKSPENVRINPLQPPGLVLGTWPILSYGV